MIFKRNLVASGPDEFLSKVKITLTTNVGTKEYYDKYEKTISKFQVDKYEDFQPYFDCKICFKALSLTDRKKN